MGVLPQLEFGDWKLAGWKRGSEGSLRFDEPLVGLPGRRRGAWEGMARESDPVLAERGPAGGAIMVVRGMVVTERVGVVGWMVGWLVGGCGVV